MSRRRGPFRIDHPLDPEYKYLSHSLRRVAGDEEPSSWLDTSAEYTTLTSGVAPFLLIRAGVRNQRAATLCARGVRAEPAESGH
jgi:hypothetical protein